MRYPTIAWSDCDEIAQKRIAGDDAPIDARWVGEGEEVDLARIAEAATEINALRREPGADRDMDHVEGRASTKLYAALCPADPHASGVPDISVLDDPGFWRYLALRYFWDFIEWRQPKAFANNNHMRFLDARQSRDTVLTRMYLRVAAVGGLQHADLAEVLTKSADFWQSHVFQVRTASSSPLVRAMTDQHTTDRLARDPLREFAKRVNGMWTNVLLNLYDDDESAELVVDLWRDDHDR